jgi:hypothetical protein
MNINALPLIGLMPRTESPALSHHNPDFSAVYWRGMASEARGIVNRNDGRDLI